MRKTPCNQIEVRQFLSKYQSAFTRRADGSRWPKWKRTWRHATEYFQGLLRPGKSKSVADIADQTGADQEQLERFVRESPWEHQNVESHLREEVPDEVQGPDAALIVDGMGIPKSGEKSVGVARQWCGATGKVDNCQVTVNCTLARAGEQHNSDQVTWPLGTRLYLPKKWTGEDDSVYETAREREKYAQLSEEAGIPEEVSYQPKYEIAVDLIDQAMAAGPDHACVVGDTGFGKYSPFREELRARDKPYVLEVETSKFVVVPAETTVLKPGSTSGRGRPRKHPAHPEETDAETPEQIAGRLEKQGGEKQDGWREVTWNEGTKGELSGEFSRTRVRVVEDRSNRWLTDETGWLLLKRSSGGEGELKAWICWGLDEASLEELVSWGQLRWTVERFHQEIKQELGADKYQGRTWRGFHHHLSAVMLAHAFVAERRLEAGKDRKDLASFAEVVRQIVRESAVQRLIETHGFDRAKAQEVAVDMLREYSDW